VSKETLVTLVVTVVLGLLGLAIAAGQGFEFTPLTWLFMAFAAIVFVIGWSRYNSSDSTR
jgi:uncharacterized membrane protein